MTWPNGNSGTSVAEYVQPPGPDLRAASNDWLTSARFLASISSTSTTGDLRHLLI